MLIKEKHIPAEEILATKWSGTEITYLQVINLIEMVSRCVA
jgi:hypothetical protein